MVEPLEILARQEGAFEIHITAPKMSVDDAEAMFFKFLRIGFPKHKYFLAVNNVPSSLVPYAAGTPPTGHDIEQPGIMATVLAHSYDNVKKLVLEAMTLVEHQCLKGNFEIERIISERVSDFKGINIERDFPGFIASDLAPLYENHFMYRGKQDSLPTHDAIIDYIQKIFGITPNQIVDFSREAVVLPNPLISRVATVYQPSREEVLRFANLMQRFSKRSDDLKYPANYSILTEQVCLVGEPIN